MKHTALSTLAAAAIWLSACKDNNTEGPQTPIESDTLTSVETNPANTSYKPAFAGQTRTSAVKTTTSWAGRVLTESLRSPWGISTLPDGRLLITEKAGTLRIVTTSGETSEAITGIPTVNAGGQGGLLGIRVDPAFATNRMVYWVFSESTANGNLTAVAKGRLSANERQIESPTVIYRATPGYGGTLHYGGRIVFDQSGNLLISTGERSDAAVRTQAQSLNAAPGKILRITKDGAPVEGNPFAAQTNARAEIYAYGFRNPQGLAIHPVTGDLWESEHGPRGGDEINRIEAGSNYGWPVITYGVEYSGATIGGGIQQQNGMQQPAYYWDPVISPSGMTFYTGNRVPEWTNNLFVGALSGQHIARLVIEDNKIVGEERLLAGESQRFRDITQGSDGALYAVTDQGRLYRIDRQ
jgi:glucose/arabinose dehydrogenase